MIENLVDFSALFISILALTTSGFVVMYTRRQVKHEENFALAETLMHFTKSYFEAVESTDKPFEECLSDEAWIERYWGLHGTEFYFFHHGTIPKTMYKIWMTDVIDIYSEHPEAWEKHLKYLAVYGVVYPQMREFFIRINKIAQADIKQEEKYARLSKYIDNWHTNSKKSF